MVERHLEAFRDQAAPDRRNDGRAGAETEGDAQSVGARRASSGDRESRLRSALLTRCTFILFPEVEVVAIEASELALCLVAEV